MAPLAAGATGFVVSHNQVLTGKNAQPGYRLALVDANPNHTGTPEVRYLDTPFTRVEMPDFDTVFHHLDTATAWNRARAPF